MTRRTVASRAAALAAMLLVSSLLVVPGQAAALTGVDVALSSTTAGATGVTATVDFTTSADIPTTGTIKVTFPAGFDVSGAAIAVDGCSGVDGDILLGGSGSVAAVAVGQDVTITYTGATTLTVPFTTSMAAGATTCTLTGIDNPTAAGGTGTYTIETTDGASTLDGPTSVPEDTIVADSQSQVAFIAPSGSTDADTPVDFDAEAQDQYGNPTGDLVTYSIDSGSGAINGTGFFTPNQTGDTVINASAGGFHATTTITVSNGTLDHIAFTTAPTTTDADTQQTFVAEGQDALDNLVGGTITYSIDSGSGSINGTGVFTPNQTGTTVIKATLGLVSGTTSITVTPGSSDSIAFTVAPNATDADTQKTFTALVYDANLNPTEDAITYSIDSGSGSVNGTGFFTPNQTGTTVIKATSGVLSTTSSIVVSAGAADSITFTVAPNATDADTQKTFTALVYDANLNPTEDAITYSIDSGSGSVNGTGFFTPNQTGTTVIKAASGAVSSTTSIVVSAGAVDSVAFTTAPGSTDADTLQTFEAEARDANLNPTGDTTVWSIDSGSGSVNGTGVFTPDKVGTTVIKAAVGVVSATSSINVSAGAADSIAFTTAPTTTDTATNKTFVAKVYDANLNLVGDAITYSIDSGSGSINGTSGVFTPDAAGTTTINATTGVLWGTTDIVVSAIDGGGDDGGSSDGDSGSQPKTSYGAAEGEVVTPVPKTVVTQVINVGRGAIDTILLELAEEQELVLRIDTYGDAATDLPDGYRATPVHFDIRTEPDGIVTHATIALRPISTDTFDEGAIGSLVILHKVDGQWVEVPTTITQDEDGVHITFQTTSLSPFALVYLGDMTDDTPPPTEPTDPGEPEPSEPEGLSVVAILILVGGGVLLALAVASVVLSKRGK